jgi:CheY-like chemotaxis protein
MPESLDILVVDDEEGIRLYLHRVLTGLGFSCVQAADGKEGLRCCSRKHYDVVFLDLVMPRMDGESVLLKIKERYPDTAVVIVSVQDDEDAIREVLGLGATAYLTKPVRPEALTDVLQTLLRAKASDPEGSSPDA